MTTFAADNPNGTQQQPRIDLNDRVLAPDGRGGNAVGFHSWPKTVLVRFDSGDSTQYPPEDLHRVGPGGLAEPRRVIVEDDRAVGSTTLDASIARLQALGGSPRPRS